MTTRHCPSIATLFAIIGALVLGGIAPSRAAETLPPITDMSIHRSTVSTLTAFLEKSVTGT